MCLCMVWKYLLSLYSLCNSVWCSYEIILECIIEPALYDFSQLQFQSENQWICRWTADEMNPSSREHWDAVLIRLKLTALQHPYNSLCNYEVAQLSSVHRLERCVSLELPLMPFKTAPPQLLDSRALLYCFVAVCSENCDSVYNIAPFRTQ